MRISPQLSNCSTSTLRPQGVVKKIEPEDASMGGLPVEIVTMIFKHAGNLNNLLDLQMNRFSQTAIARVLREEHDLLREIPGCLDLGKRIDELRLRYRFLPFNYHHILVAKTLAQELKRDLGIDGQLPARPNPAFVSEYTALQQATQDQLDHSIDVLFEQIQLDLQLPNPPETTAQKRAWLNDPLNEGALSWINQLDLSEKELKILPPEISKLTRLWLLALSDNQIASLPESIGKLTGLQELNLSNNQLTSLPESLGNLTGLTGLYLSDNQLTSLPKSVGNLTRLTRLYLSHNQLTSLPESVENLTGLKGLDLSNNQLTSLPESVGKLAGLNWLDLDNNRLTSLPESIGKLTGLSSLYLSKNQLTSLPESIGDLTGLQEFSLSENPIEHIPESLINSKNLKISSNKTILEYVKNTAPITRLYRTLERGESGAYKCFSEAISKPERDLIREQLLNLYKADNSWKKANANQEQQKDWVKRHAFDQDKRELLTKAVKAAILKKYATLSVEQKAGVNAKLSGQKPEDDVARLANTMKELT